MPARLWPAAVAAYQNPQSLVAFGQGGAAGAVDAEGGDGETDLEVQLRQRAEARSAAAMERARRRAARRAAEVSPATINLTLKL